jgi:hypothetical protein
VVAPTTPIYETIVTTSNGKVITVTQPVVAPTTPIYETIVTTSNGKVITVTQPVVAPTTPIYETIVTTSNGKVITVTQPVVAPTPGTATIATVSRSVLAVSSGTSISQVNGAVSTSKNVYGLVGGALLAAAFLA